MVSMVKVLVMLQCFVVATYGFAQLTFGHGYLRRHAPTVAHYATHTLCKNNQGKLHFYTALRKKFCDVRREFTAELVWDLCRRRDELLDKWVAELFDVNGDGHISHHEKQLYRREDD